MTAFVRFSQRKDLQYYAARHHRPLGRRRQRLSFTRSIRTLRSATPGRLRRRRCSKRASASRTCSPARTPPYLGGPSLQSLFGIHGLPTTPNLTGGFNTQTISGFATSLGRQTSNPQFQNPTSFDPKFNYSKIRGRHSLKVGYEFLAIRTEDSGRQSALRPGSRTRASSASPPALNWASPPAARSTADPTSYNLADFIFGLPSIISQGSYTVVNLRQHVNSLYVQDDYRVNAKLTLNVGLRWEFATPLYERDNNYSNFDPTTDTMVKATGGSIFNRALVQSRLQGFRAAHRPGLQHRFENGASQRVWHQLHLLQPARQRPGGDQRAPGAFRRRQSVHARRAVRRPPAS